LGPFQVHPLVLASCTDKRPNRWEKVDVTVLDNPLAVDVREEIIEVIVDVILVAALKIPDNEETGKELMMLDKLTVLNKELRFKVLNNVVTSDSKVEIKELREGVVTEPDPEPPTEILPIVIDPDPDADPEAAIAAIIALTVLVILAAALEMEGNEYIGREPIKLETLTVPNNPDRLRVDNKELTSDSTVLTSVAISAPKAGFTAPTAELRHEIVVQVPPRIPPRPPNN